MINLYGMEMKKLQDLMVAEGQKPYRAIQLYTWIYELIFKDNEDKIKYITYEKKIQNLKKK